MLQRIEKRRPAPANKHRLNDRFISDLQPKEKAFLVWDTMQRGLLVKVEPTSHRSFKCFYSRRGKSRWCHLADATAINVAQARKLANEIMYQVAQGKDPAQTTKAIARTALEERAGLAPCVPVPAGGMTTDRVREMLDFYGADVMLLIGGALLGAGEHLSEATAAFVAEVQRYPHG